MSYYHRFPSCCSRRVPITLRIRFPGPSFRLPSTVVYHLSSFLNGTIRPPLHTQRLAANPLATGCLTTDPITSPITSPHSATPPSHLVSVFFHLPHSFSVCSIPIDHLHPFIPTPRRRTKRIRIIAPWVPHSGQGTLPTTDQTVEHKGPFVFITARPLESFEDFRWDSIIPNNQRFPYLPPSASFKVRS